MSLIDVLDPGDAWARQVATRVHFAMDRWTREDLLGQIREFNSSPLEWVSFLPLDTTETTLGISCLLNEQLHTGASTWIWVKSLYDWHVGDHAAQMGCTDSVIIDARMFAGIGKPSPEWCRFINGPFERVKSIAASIDPKVDITSTELVSPEGAPLTFQISDVVLGKELTGNVDADVLVILGFIFPKVREFLTYKCLEGLLEHWCERENQKLIAQLALTENNDLRFRDFELMVNRKVVRVR